jgi:branched-chain amino acid aminotransferase
MKIKIDKVEKTRLNEVDFDNINFGSNFTDHMFVADFKDGEWQNPRVEPFNNIELSPAAVCLHYGQEVFEGMKAFRQKDGEVVLFRPEENAKRINKSAERLAVPEVPEELFLSGLKEMLKLDKEWVPSISQGSLYIRPFIFASEPFLGMRAANEYKFMIIASPAGLYYDKPINVKVETKYSRACPGGTGYSKAAGNYAGSLRPTQIANEEGFDQILWTDACEHKYIEESGTMNVFFLQNGKLITPELTDSILHGITRDSVLKLAQEFEIEIEEKKISVDEIIEGIESGEVTEAFGVGTAVNVAEIRSLSLDGKKFELKELDENSAAFKIKGELEQIRSGETEDKFDWIEKV